MTVQGPPVVVIDAAVSWLDTLGSGIERAGTVAGTLSGAYPCYSVYQAADGVGLAVGALELQFWRAFCGGLGREDLVPRQFDPESVPEVAAIIATRTAAEWLNVFDDDACVARVNLPSEALDDPHIRERRSARASAGAAPGLGDDTHEVLADAGVGSDDRSRLEESGVVAGPQTPERAARAARLGSMLARMADRQKRVAA